MQKGDELMQKKIKVNEIEEFIQIAFLSYNSSYSDFFSEYDDEKDELFELPMSIDGQLIPSVIGQVALILGVDAKDILSMNGKKVFRWKKKYPYFELKEDFDFEYGQSFLSGSAKKENLEKAIFSDNGFVPDNTPFYNADRVFIDLNNLIDKIDEKQPGFRHKEAKLSFVEMQTETLFEFDKLEDMMSSYFEAFDNMTALFFKAWDTELSHDEIQEYNFLVSFLGIRDKCWKLTVPLHYEILKKFIPIYKKEGYKDIFDYIKIGTNKIPQFWKCGNFAEYPNYVNRMIKIYPNMKREMRKIIMKTKNVRCAYLWSDEEKPYYNPEYEAHFLEILWQDFGDHCASHYHFLFIPKSKQELGTASKYIEQYSQMTKSEKLGGLTIPSEISVHELIHRMGERISVIHDFENGSK